MSVNASPIFEMGVSDYLTQPVSEKALLNAIATHLPHSFSLLNARRVDSAYQP